MKNGIRSAGLLAAIMVVPAIDLVATRPALADGPTLPFAGTFSGEAFFDSQISAVFHGTGRATHLGEATNDGVLYPLVPETTSECEAGWGIRHTNTETLTAANGDRLVLVMSDLACPVGPNVFEGSGFWQVSDGTGRFAGASGWGTVVGGGDFNRGSFEFTLTGQISISTGG